MAPRSTWQTRASAPDLARLRIALLVYRGNPYCGGQGVYTRHLARGLVERGHAVTVFAGQPYPHLDAGVDFVALPSLDLYREPEPFRHPRLRELASAVDVLELATMFAGGFPEPRTFSLRAHRSLAKRRGAFDIVHDDQSLGTGLLHLMRDGWQVLSSIHHPIAIDRQVDLEQAQSAAKRVSLKRWYGFSAMQDRVAVRLPQVITVSQSSKRDIVEHMGIEAEAISVVPVGVDTSLYRPLPVVARVPGRIITTASADVPLKGLQYLLEALAKVRTEMPDAHLVVVGKLREHSAAKEVIERLGLDRCVQFVSGLSDEELVRQYATAQVAVVPSLYEGFSLPAIEAMACELALVVTSGGALPEVVGDDGLTARVVPPGDAHALGVGLISLLEDAPLRARLGSQGRARVMARFTWAETARATEERYRIQLAGTR